ncbi:hypothetical protein J6590_001657 [Homalodisca vitripennis]|nr:hypothetical protein J6590_001657 [Homalodisca vitripennis]
MGVPDGSFFSKYHNLSSAPLPEMLQLWSGFFGVASEDALHVNFRPKLGEVKLTPAAVIVSISASLEAMNQDFCRTLGLGVSEEITTFQISSAYSQNYTVNSQCVEMTLAMSAEMIGPYSKAAYFGYEVDGRLLQNPSDLYTYYCFRALCSAVDTNQCSCQCFIYGLIENLIVLAHRTETTEAEKARLFFQVTGQSYTSCVENAHNIRRLLQGELADRYLL